MENNIHVISLGAGVQSSTLAMMASLGLVKHLPMPIAAVFADTQAEPESVYRWLDWLETQVEFPIIRATAGDLAKDSTRVRISKKSGNGYLKPALPVYVIKTDGSKGMLRRGCTMDYKIRVIHREVKKLIKKCQAKTATQWIGISVDEANRQKASREPKVTNVWPLIDMGMSRTDCIRWWQDKGLPSPPRSACVFCPFHSDREWLRLKNDEPIEFERAVQYESQLRESIKPATGLSAKDAFLHRSCKPLDQVRFDNDSASQPMLLECEGMCGV